MSTLQLVMACRLSLISGRNNAEVNSRMVTDYQPSAGIIVRYRRKWRQQNANGTFPVRAQGLGRRDPAIIWCARQWLEL
jgi:hypothetical protein